MAALGKKAFTPIAIGAAVGAAAIAITWSASQRDAAPPPPPREAPAKEAGNRIAVDPGDLGAVPAGQRPVVSILNVPNAMRYGQFVWDDKGVAPGPAWVRIDLDAQIISVFRSGQEIGTAVILYGADKKPTPTGRFPVLAKLKDHKSSIYDAAMPYTLRLTNDGIAIHGSNVQYGLATNGCIGIPEGFAAKLFDEMKVGSEVVILRPGSGEAA